MPLTNNILSFDTISPNSKAKALAERARQRRLELNLTQEGLSAKAGISLAACRRFEQTGKISLDGLLQIAYALDALNDFDQVFATPKIQHIGRGSSSQSNHQKKGETQ